MKRIVLLCLVISIMSCDPDDPCGGSSAPGPESVSIREVSSVKERRLISADEGSEIDYDSRNSLPQKVPYTGYVVSVNMDYSSNYQSSLSPKRDFLDFFVSPAYSCSLGYPDFFVAQTRIETLEIISFDNYDKQHPSGSLLNDIFLINHRSDKGAWRTENLMDFLNQKPKMPLIFHIYLVKPPEMEGEFNFKLNLYLEDGKEFQINFGHFLTQG